MSVLLPSSKDIFFEIDKRKVAIVQNYSTSYTKEDREVDSFGEEEVIGYTNGKKKYSIRITKAYVTDAALKDGINFYNIDNFEFVIVKPDRRVVYSGCSIQQVDEEGSLNDIIAENITIRAARRREDPV